MKRSSIFLVILGFLLATAAWWVLIIGPRNDDVDAAETQLFTEERQGNLLRTQIARLNAINEQELSYTFAIGDMERSIPELPDFDAFLEDVTFLAERTGVDIVTISAVPPIATSPDEDATLFRIDVNLSLEGQFFEVLGFLFGLEDIERLIRVDTISLNPIADLEEVTTTTAATTTTTTTVVPDGSAATSTSSTSSTTTTTTTTTTLTPERVRPEPGLLFVTLTTTLFTRTPVATPAVELPVATTLPPVDEEEEP